ncbi:Secreted RxLR effector protein 3 [Phytophthora ramorum]|uniref:Secreted RxLR effector protein 3 n=1 Tax=Phytophthora ramorum TaxID=164328 RepID=UPI0030A631C3|nr:Secreted RxLR effector protein 3 [Phytophthora ramorum]
MSDSSLQIAFCPQAHKFLPTMRFSCVLLVAAAALVASTSSLSTEPDQEKRLLRSHKTADVDDTQNEERGTGIGWIDDIFPSEMIKRLRSQLEYRRTMFANWKRGMQSADEAEAILRAETSSAKTIATLKEKYQLYLDTKTVT